MGVTMRPVLKNFPEALQLNESSQILSHQQVQWGLLEMLGAYCSYCECRIEQYEIEHYKFQKQWKTPLYPSDWQHMLLICSHCRAHMTQDILSQAAHDQHLWPDLHPTHRLDQPSPFVYQLEPVRYQVVDGARIVSDEDIELVMISTNPACDPDTVQKAQKTIELFQLNTPYIDPNDEKKLIVPWADHLRMSDVRAQLRTEAWQEALFAVEHYQIIAEEAEMNDLPQLYKPAQDQIRGLSKAHGHWSIWMTVFANAFNNQELLVDLFVGHRLDEAEPHLHFAGTAHTRLRFKQTPE